MMTVGNRLKALTSKRHGTQRALAKYCGVSNSAVSNWIAGGGITHENMLKIADFFNVPFEWLAHGKGPIPIALQETLTNGSPLSLGCSKDDLQPNGFSVLKEYTLVFNTETGQLPNWEVDAEYGSTLWIPNSVFTKHRTTSENCRVIRFMGMSMEPTLSNDDLVVCKLESSPYPHDVAVRDGHIYVLSIDKKLCIKRLSRIKDGYRLSSDNPAYEHEDYGDAQANRILIFGQAIYVTKVL